jgi:multisubunit Na+/H+ antiporter MnhC subunit
MLVILGKVAISLFGMIVYWISGRNHHLSLLSNRDFTRSVIALFIVSRAAMFMIVVIGISGSATSDVSVYYAEAKSALAGQLPLVDIKTAYGPLFPYLAALPVLLWDDAMAIIVVSIVLELVTVLSWLAFSRDFLPEAITRHAAILYLCCPLSLCNVPITGQNHVWIAAGLAGALVLVARGRAYGSGLMLGFTIIGVKFLSLLFAPPLVLAAYRKAGLRGAAVWMTGFLVLPIVAYGLLLGRGLDLTDQVRFHAYYDSSGNLPYLLTLWGSGFSDPMTRFATNAAGFAALCLLFLVVWARGGVKTPVRVAFTCAFVVIIVLLVSKKAFTSYILVALFPVCLVVVLDAGSRRSLPIAFLVWSLIATIEPTLWFRLMDQADLSGVVAAPSVSALSFAVVQVVLIAGYLLLLRSAFRLATGYERP